MIEIKKLPTETEEQFLWKVGQLVDSGQVENWGSINEIINREILGDDETTYRTESAWRKRYQAGKKFYDNCFVKMESGKIQEENSNQLIEIEKQRVKARRERNELRRIIREESDKESYLEQFIRTMQEYVEEPLAYEENARFQGELNTDNDLICSFSDVHAGISTDNYFNTYNKDILRERMNQYLDKIYEVQLCHGSENCHLILSELLSGIIHPTLRIENNQDLMQQFLMITDYLSQFIASLSYRFNTVHVYMCMGNHSRISPKKEESLTGENMDVLAIPFLSAKLQNYKNIEWHENDIEKSIAIFNVRGNLVMASHGDKDTPNTVVQKFTMMFNQKPDLVYLFHRHTNAMQTVYDTKVIQSGCVSGSDSYCMDKRIKNRPEQTISVVNDNGLDCLYDVKLN